MLKSLVSVGVSVLPKLEIFFKSILKFLPVVIEEGQLERFFYFLGFYLHSCIVTIIVIITSLLWSKI